MKTRQKSNSGFTLIELLVVIVIIGILAGLLFPALRGARLQAQKAKARTEVQSIHTAIKAYYAEYGRLPANSGMGSADSFGDEWFDGAAARNVIRVLIGQNVNNLNQRQMVFLEGKGIQTGGANAGEFLDPWGNQYKIKLDMNYNGKLEYFSGVETIPASAIVVSFGPSGRQCDPNASACDNIVSHK
jgi:prepilin-type N-terminal cleavage/methylation domain-containing protein